MPLSCVNSSGRISNLRIDSARDTPHWLIHRTLDFGVHDRIAGQRRQVGLLLSALRFQPRVRIGEIQRDQRGHERLPVADDQALVHNRRCHHGGLQQAGGDVLAAGGDDQILLAAGDRNEAVLVNVAQIAGVQPAVDDLLGGHIGMVVVSAADRWPRTHSSPSSAIPAVTPLIGMPIVPIRLFSGRLTHTGPQVSVMP